MPLFSLEFMGAPPTYVDAPTAKDAVVGWATEADWDMPDAVTMLTDGLWMASSGADLFCKIILIESPDAHDVARIWLTIQRAPDGTLDIKYGPPPGR